MSTNTIFYTTETFVRSAEAGGAWGMTNGANALDGNLDTFATFTGTGNPWLYIDTYPQDEDDYLAGRGKASGSYETVGFWIQNYHEDLGSYLLTVYDSYNADSTDIRARIGNEAVGDGPLFFTDLDNPIERRYVRFILHDLDTDVSVNVSFVGIHKKRTVPTVPEYPVNVQPQYYTDVVKMRGGRDYRSAQAGNSTFNFDQQYTFPSVANKEEFDNVFNDSHGRLSPLIYQPPTVINPEDAYLCYLEQDRLNETEIDHEYYKATLKFKTLPYIKGGENF